MDKSIGVIDIGSNSVHLVVGRYHNDDYFYIIDDVKVNVRLCEGLSETGYLEESRMLLGEETLMMFKNMCDTYKLDQVIAVATAAVRKAKNGLSFVDRIKKATGIDINIIPGETEAIMDYLGAINTIDIKDALLMDIGGGSVEFVLIKEREMQDAISLPFGSIDLSEKFELSDQPTEKALEKLNLFLEKEFAQCSIFKAARGLPLIGVGGTIRNIGRIHRYNINYPLEIAHNYRMNEDEVYEICDMTAKMNLEERKNLKGLSKGRSDIFVGAGQAVLKVMEIISSPTLIISDAGLRDGIIQNYFGNGPDNLIHNIFGQSLLNTMLNFDVNIPHAYHVYGLADKLFKQLAPLHGIKEETMKMRKASAMLHDVGIKIQYSNHHEHSFYLILNAGLKGMLQKEVLMSAFIALNHRTNKKIKVEEAYMTLLDNEDKRLIDQLSLFLQIAEYLDRSMDGIVKDLKCQIKDEEIEITVLTTIHSVFSDMIISECGKKFKRVFNKELVITNKMITMT
ncbi:MAG: Ppx/GppA phosphatase family protein [Eubacterium sp.]